MLLRELEILADFRRFAPLLVRKHKARGSNLRAAHLCKHRFARAWLSAPAAQSSITPATSKEKYGAPQWVHRIFGGDGEI